MPVRLTGQTYQLATDISTQDVGGGNVSFLPAASLTGAAIRGAPASSQG
jgi:hypothetical protein